MKNRRVFFVFCLFILMDTASASEGRWYSDEQVQEGSALFQQHCVECHAVGARAQRWNHSLAQLKQTIQRGSREAGNSMPAFSSQLSATEIESTIAFFQSKWPDNIYAQWAQHLKVNATESPPANITKQLQQQLGRDDIGSITATGIEGVYQVQIGESYAHLVGGGRYIIAGDLFDLEKGQNITQLNRYAATLAQVPLADTVLYPAHGQERALLNVFTDTSCAYCRRFHADVSILQKAGISVRYFPFPRGGSAGPGYADLTRIWCAADRQQAMDIAKGLRSGELPAGSCDAAGAVDRGFALGSRLGIAGTPTLYSENGVRFNGYIPYAKLIPMLLDP